MRQKFFVSCLMLVLIIAFSGVSFAAKKGGSNSSNELTFSGNLTIIINGKETAVNGSANIPMPETFRVETQDDDPGVMAELFKKDGRTTEKAAIIAKTSEPFIISGKRVLDIYTIRDNKLVKLANKQIPAKTGDYYIYIKNTKKEDKEEDELDAVILQYIKISVE